MTWLVGLLLVACIIFTIVSITLYFVRLFKNHKKKSAADSVALDDEPSDDDTTETEETPDPICTESSDEN